MKLSERSQGERIAALAACVGLVSGLRLDGIFGAGILVASLLFLPHPFPFAVGQTAVVSLLAPFSLPFVVAELGLVGLLVAPLLQAYHARRGLSIAFVWSLVVGSSLAAVVWTGGNRYALAVTLVGSAALAMYGLHRYELVRLGLVADEEGPR